MILFFLGARYGLTKQPQVLTAIHIIDFIIIVCITHLSLVLKQPLTLLLQIGIFILPEIIQQVLN